MGVAASLDARAGGRYRVEVLPGDAVLGEFVELDPPRRLVQTWGWESASGSVPAGSTTVAFDLVKRDDGTLVRVTHTGLSRGAAGTGTPAAGTTTSRDWHRSPPAATRGPIPGSSGPSCDPVSRKEGVRCRRPS